MPWCEYFNYDSCWVTLSAIYGKMKFTHCRAKTWTKTKDKTLIVRAKSAKI